MLINIPSKEETITFFHVKTNAIVMFHRKLIGTFPIASNLEVHFL